MKASLCPKWIRSSTRIFTPLGQHPRNRNLQGSLTIFLVLCPAEIASRLGLLEGDAHYRPREDCAHTWTIPAVIYDTALPDEVLSCPAGIFSGKMVSENDVAALSDVSSRENQGQVRRCRHDRVCLTMSVWNHNWSYSVVAS